MKTVRLAVSSLALGITLALPLPAFAEHFYLGYSYWDYKVSGNYSDSTGNYDLNNDFSPSASSRALYRLRWDTGPGWWFPDLAASFNRIEVTGHKNVTTNTSIGPIPITVNTNADAHANVRDLDVTARWPWQFGWGRLSLGVTGKQLRGNILIKDSTAGVQTRENIDATFPMAHAFLELPLGSRLRIGVGGDWAALDGDAADNITAMARLKVIGPLDLTAGWQRKHYKVNQDGYHLDTRLQGWQAGAEIGF